MLAIHRRWLLLCLASLALACGGAQSGADDQLIPPPPDEGAPPDNPRAQQSDSGAPPLQGAYWDLAVQARAVDEHARHEWEASVRALDDEHRTAVIEALEGIAGEPLTIAGLRRAAGRASSQRLPGGDGGDAPWVGAYQRGVLYVLQGMVARIGEGVGDERDPVAAGAELLRSIRALRLPGSPDPAPLLREAREAMGGSVAAQAEVRSQPHH